MAITRTFEGVREPDVALLHTGGVSYRCYVYLRPAVNRVEAVVTRCGEDGTNSLVDRAVIQFQSDLEVPLDCPKVIAVGTLFIAHWIAYTSEGCGLYRSIFDCTAIATGWSAPSFVTVHQEALYDVDPVTGSDDFVVAYKTDTDDITVSRFESPYAWADDTWTTTYSVGVLHCLSVAADDALNTCLVTREVDPEGATAHTLWTLRVDADDGTNSADVETMPDIEAADNHYVACPQVLATSANRWLVVAEFVTAAHAGGTAPETNVRGVCWTVVNGATAAPVSETQYVQGYGLLSRPWTWASGFVGEAPKVYAMLSYKSLSIDLPWNTTEAIFVDLDCTSTLAATDPHTVFPIPVGAVTDGSIDGRGAGRSPESTAEPSAASALDARRTNHPSHVAPPPQYDRGPELASVTIACQAFERLMPAHRHVTGESVSSTLYPVNFAVRGYIFDHEDPWLYRRELKSPTAPDDANVKACVPWTPGQSADIGPALCFGGGVQHCYAGEQLVELGYVHPPEIVEIVDGSNSVSSTFPAGLYWYTYTYAWPDEHGQLHRSGPAQPVSFDHGGVGTPSPDLVLRTMGLSLKDNTTHYPLARPILLEVWRTYMISGVFDGQADGVYLLRRVWSSTDPTDVQPLEDTPVNDKTTWSVTVHDDQGNDQVSVAELLPWQLDTTTLQWSTPPPVPPPSVDVISRWDDRLVGAKESRLYYSEPIGQLGTQFVLPEFNDTNTFSFDGDGTITLVEQIDNHKIVATRDMVFALVGEGAAGGVGATFQRQVVSDGIGCLEPRSVVNVPGVGVFFQSDQGYHLLDRGLGVSYLDGGAAVDDMIRESGNVRAATHLADRHQVRVSLNGRPLQQLQIGALFGGTPTNGTYTVRFEHPTLPDGVNVSVPRASGVPASNTLLAAAMATAIEAETDLAHLIDSASNDTVTCEIFTVAGVSGLVVTQSAPAPGTITLTETALDPVTVPRVLIYDYLVKQWSEIPFVDLGSATEPRLNEMQGGCSWRGQQGEVLHVALQTGGLAIERASSDTTFADTTHTTTVGVCVDITLEWIHLDGIAGLKRVREVEWTTRRLNPGAMAAQVWTDVDGEFSTIATPQDRSWADPAPSALKLKLRVQKHTANMLRLYEPSNGDQVEGVVIKGVTMEVGTKTKLRRTASTNRGT